MSTPAKPDATLPAVPFRRALFFWLKLGFISFGGPAGQIALMHQELVEKQRWISERRFLHALNYCMLLPGPEAQQLATYMGWLLHRTWGGIIAGALFVLPSLFILIALSWAYLVYGDQPLVASIFYGIKPAVAAIVVHAAYRLGMRTLCHPAHWAIATAAFIGIFALQLPFPLVVVSAAALGFIGGKWMPAAFSPKPAQGAEALTTSASAHIDDNTYAGPHTEFRWHRLALILVTGALLWAIPMGLLTLSLGWQHSLTQMSWFFTKAAFLTFGGAYAVLPYVYQGAVSHFQWLSPSQMMDGLALGETTPGPLIMLVAFVAFVGAYTQAPFGQALDVAAGALAAVLVTWFTFLPSFLFILAGGPLVESTRGKLGFTAPLTAIGAALVGVIINLALFFGYHIFLPQGFTGHLDGTAVLICIASAIALFYFKRSLVTVILGAGAAGACLGLLQLAS